MSDQTTQTFHVVSVVWGQRHVEMFLDVAVPNQLTAGNLGALPVGSRYRVFTAREDVEALAASPVLGRVAALMPVDLEVMPELSESSVPALHRMTTAHCRALTDARDTRAALVFLNADCFISEGALDAVVRRHSAGSRAVVCTGIRLNRDEFVAALRARGVQGLPPRELAKLAMDHLHAFTLAHMIDASQTARGPISVYWKVPGEGILARSFFLHPLMIDPVCPDAMPETTIDAKYVARACPAYEDIHVVTDSDELSVFELSGTDEAVNETVLGGIRLWRAATMFTSRDSHQKRYWTHPIRIHGRDLGPAWKAVETESARFARRVMRLRLAVRWIGLAAQRMKRLQRETRWSMKRARKAMRPLSPARIRRVRAHAARGIQRLGDSAVRAARTTVRRAHRSTLLLTHSVARPVHKLRKRTVRVGRRALRRARVGL
jgi:hypothetical protein